MTITYQITTRPPRDRADTQPAARRARPGPRRSPLLSRDEIRRAVFEMVG